MRLTGPPPQPGSAAVLRCVPEEPEDFWALYGLIQPGDRVQAVTVRKVAVSSAEGAPQERVQLRLTLVVEGAEYEGGAAGSGAGAALRVRGRNATECDGIKLGAFHTLELQLGRPVGVEKGAWGAAECGAVAAALDAATSRPTAVLLIDDARATLLLVGAALTRVAWRGEAPAGARKGGGGGGGRGAGAAAGAARALRRFHEHCLAALQAAVPRPERLQALLLAGPGFAPAALAAFLFGPASPMHRPGGGAGSDGGGGGGAGAASPPPPPPHGAAASAGGLAFAPALAAAPAAAPLLAACLARLVVAHASCAHPHALAEALADPRAAAAVAAAAASSGAAALARWRAQLSGDPHRALYGPGACAAAAAMGAVAELLLTDALLRAGDPPLRLRWEAVAAAVEAAGGVVHHLRGDHPPARQLAALAGAAATLRYPLPRLAEAEAGPDGELVGFEGE